MEEEKMFLGKLVCRNCGKVVKFYYEDNRLIDNIHRLNIRNESLCFFCKHKASKKEEKWVKWKGQIKTICIQWLVVNVVQWRRQTINNTKRKKMQRHLENTFVESVYKK